MPEIPRAESVEAPSQSERPSTALWLRLGWVVASYLTRTGIVLAVLACIALFTSACLMNRTSATIRSVAWLQGPPQPPPPHLNIISKEQWARVRASRKQLEVDGLNLGGVATVLAEAPQVPPAVPKQGPRPRRRATNPLPAEPLLEILREFPNLRTLDLPGYVTDQVMAGVAQLSGLEYLRISGRNEPDLATLPALPKLRWIEFQTLGPPANVASLAKLPALETVVVTYRDAINDDVVAELARLPRLKTLSLRLFGARSSDTPTLTAKGLAALRRAPALQTLYLGPSHSPGDGLLWIEAHDQLPHIKVTPTIVRERGYGFYPLQTAGFIGLGLVIGVQLSSQFRSSLRKLAPAFVAPHVLVALIAATLIVLICTIYLVALGCTWPAAVAVAAALVASAVATGTASSAGGLVSWKGMRQYALIGPALLFALVAILFVPASAEAILYSPHPLVLAGLTGWTIAAVAGAGWVLSRLVYSTTAMVNFESRSAVKPFDIFWTMPVPAFESRSAVKPFKLRRRFPNVSMFILRNRERQIESYISGAKLTWWQRVVCWRAANPPGRTVAFPLIMTFWFSLCSMVPGFFATGNQGSLVPPPLLAMMLVGLSCHIAGMWRLRMRMLPMEILRPGARHAVQSELLAGWVLDLFTGSAISSVFMAVLSNVDQNWHVAWTRVPLDYFVLVAMGIPVELAFGSILIAVQRTRRAVGAMFVLAVLLYVSFGATLIGTMATKTIQPSEFTIRFFGAFLWAPALLAVVLICFMRRAWFRLEPGRWE